MQMDNTTAATPLPTTAAATTTSSSNSNHHHFEITSEEKARYKVSIKDIHTVLYTIKVIF